VDAHGVPGSGVATQGCHALTVRTRRAKSKM